MKTVDTINLTSSAFAPIARQILTKLLVAAGTWLVAQGYLTQDAANAAVPELVGLVLIVGAGAYSAIMAKRKNDKAVNAATSKPGDGTVVMVDGAVVNP